jgi:hypothetical protein
MNRNTDTRRLGTHTRPVFLLPAFVVALSLAFTGAASAAAFQATVNGINPPGTPQCPTTLTFCGTASIAGLGPATWTLTAVSTTPASGPCPGARGLASAFTYTATTTFQLLSDGGALVLDESGLVCAPGNSASAPPQAFGFPEYAQNSSWTVVSATGPFSGLTGGTDALHAAGARISGAYSGT